MGNKVKIALSVLFLAGIITFIAGCRTEPIGNVINYPIVQLNSHITLSQVKEAVLSAGKDLGWKMKEENKNLIMATLDLRGHQAVVKINYGPKYYSIMYVSSKNLMYDNYNINKFYNLWIRNLQNKINEKLEGATETPQK
ncbi:MAG TPA: hypothetical protein QF753_09545 [Victivallales bacterium]|nr:hypothetical protein [Victivallales bacterium]